MLVRLSNTPRDYAWGSTHLIATLEGRPPTAHPEAEVWFGDHPGSSALVGDGTGETLDAWLAARGRPSLPYLLKLLAAASPLSIQAHPSKDEAVAGFAREEAAGIPRDAASRTYRDDNHKPEIIVAVSDRFRALVGLRPLARTRVLVAALGDAPGVRALAGRLAGDDEPAVLRAALEWLLSGRAQDTVDAVVAALADAEADGFADDLAVLRDVAAAYPGDPGVVVALLMNVVVLRRGEALFAPAGVLHAYQDGLGVELMAASDNVLRGGLTPKHLDVPELLRIVDTTPGPAPIVVPRDEDGVQVFDVGIPDFTLRRVRLAAGEERRMTLAGPTIALAVDGAPEVAAGAESVRLAPGGAAFADEDDVVLHGPGEVFLAEPGRHADDAA